MKKSILMLLMVAFPFLSNSGQNKGEMTKVGKSSHQWDNTTKDLGTIAQNQPQTVEFKLKNTGEEPVVIIKAEGSCGCTQIVYPQEPIKPGETGILKATYNAAAKGAFNKTVKVTLGNNDFETLTMKGVVE